MGASVENKRLKKENRRLERLLVKANRVVLQRFVDGTYASPIEASLKEDANYSSEEEEEDETLGAAEPMDNFSIYRPLKRTSIAERIPNLPAKGTAERKRVLDRMHSKQKRIRRKERNEALESSCTDLRVENERLKSENTRLELLVVEANRVVLSQLSHAVNNLAPDASATAAVPGSSANEPPDVSTSEAFLAIAI